MILVNACRMNILVTIKKGMCGMNCPETAEVLSYVWCMVYLIA
jgi:hypothetical protein